MLYGGLCGLLLVDFNDLPFFVLLAVGRVAESFLKVSTRQEVDFGNKTVAVTRTELVGLQGSFSTQTAQVRRFGAN